MKIYKPFIFLVFSLVILAGCKQKSEQFSSAVSRFDDHYDGAKTMYFYPAVIGILNFQDDSTVANLTRNIRKFKIITYSKDSMNPAIADTLLQGVRDEKFKDIIDMNNNGSNLSLFLKKNGKEADHFVLVAHSPENITIVDLLGEIPFKYIPALLTGKIDLGGIESVVNYKPKRKKKNQKSEDGKRTRNK